MPPRASYRIGVLGLDHWYWATSLVPLILKHPRCELSVLWDSRPDRIKAVNWPAKRIAADPAEITDDPGLDLVVSFLPCPANARWLTRAAQHGKAVISDKPVAMTVAQAAPLAAALRKSGRPSFSLEFSDALAARTKFIKAILKQGGLGRPLTAYSALRGGMPKAWWDAKGSGRKGWGWWTDARQVPGGAWIDHSIYAIPKFRYLLNDRPVAVSATMRNIKYPKAALPVEDYGIASYVYAKGTVATLEYDWIGGSGQRHEIVCANGAIRWAGGLKGNEVEIRSKKGTKVHQVPKSWKNGNVLDAMLAALDTGRETVSPVRDGVDNLRLALAAYRSARTGRSVKL